MVEIARKYTRRRSAHCPKRSESKPMSSIFWYLHCMFTLMCTVSISNEPLTIPSTVCYTWYSVRHRKVDDGNG